MIKIDLEIIKVGVEVGVDLGLGGLKRNHHDIEAEVELLIQLRMVTRAQSLRQGIKKRNLIITKRVAKIEDEIKVEREKKEIEVEKVIIIDHQNMEKTNTKAPIQGIFPYVRKRCSN